MRHGHKSRHHNSLNKWGKNDYENNYSMVGTDGVVGKQQRDTQKALWARNTDQVDKVWKALLQKKHLS